MKNLILIYLLSLALIFGVFYLKQSHATPTIQTKIKPVIKSAKPREVYFESRTRYTNTLVHIKYDTTGKIFEIITNFE